MASVVHSNCPAIQQTEAQVPPSRQRWRDIVESAVDWVWETDANHTLAYVSSGYARLLGLAAGPDAADDCRGILPPDLAAWPRQVREMGVRQPFHDIRLRLSAGDRPIHVSLSGRPSFDAEGHFLGYRGVGYVVVGSEDGDNDRQLRRLADTIEHLSHGITIFDRDDRLVLANEYARRRFFGASAFPPLGSAFADYVRLMGQGRTKDPAVLARWIEEHTHWHRHGLCHECPTPDGRWLLVQDLNLPDGSTVISHIDITELKQREQALRNSEARFRAIFQDAAIGIAVVQAGERITQANQALGTMLGYGVDELATMRYPDLVHSDDIEDESRLARKLIDGEIDSYRHEIRYLRKDGGIFWGRLTVSMVQGNGTERFGLVMIEDIDQRKRAQLELCKAKEVAEQANLAKTRFLAAASHDLRQPLQALSMFVAVLASRTHAPEDAALIKRIEESVGAVEALLNGLLDVSKLEAGLVVPVFSSFDIGPLLMRLTAEFEPLMAEAGLGLRMVPSHALVRSDPALLERILRNLLNNALRYTKQGKILLGCRRRGNRLRIEVWDTGVGIPQSELKLIFREFHQLGNSARDRRQGLGLGLAIVDRLAQLLDHRIDVQSQPHKGSGFSVELPFANAVALSSPARQLPLQLSRRNATILVIDDEPDVLESVRLLLESWGFTVVSAVDCDEALNQLSEGGKKPDLILADYRLQKGATGAQAISRIRTRLKAVLPAIILTGDTAPQRLRQAQASGHGLLHKPVQPAALHQMIDELLVHSPA